MENYPSSEQILRNVVFQREITLLKNKMNLNINNEDEELWNQIILYMNSIIEQFEER